MNFEFAYYIFLLTLGFIICALNANGKLVKKLTLCFFVLYFFVVRFSGYDVDMVNYEALLSENSLDLYYLKEPVYWFLSRVVFYFSGSSQATFIFIDCISLVVVAFSIERLRLPTYFYYVFFLMFPAVMGLNNVYRQYLSLCLFILFMSLVFDGRRKIITAPFLVLSVLTHNMAALFLPLAFLCKNERVPVYFFVFSILALLTIPIAVSTKSVMDTGTVDIRYYVALISLIFLFFLFSIGFRVSGSNLTYFFIFIYFLSLLLCSSYFMGGGQSKRVGMFCLTIISIFLFKIIESEYKEKRLVAPFFYLFLTLPTIVFSSSRSMLFSTMLN